MIKSIVTNEKKLSVVSEPTNDADLIAKIITDLTDTANHWQGKPCGCAGLAANQIGYLYRVFIVFHGSVWLPFINPEIQPIPGRGKFAREGCLSRPGVTKKMQRYKKIRTTSDDLAGGLNRERLYSGFTARVIQHENDHLNGVYI